MTLSIGIVVLATLTPRSGTMTQPFTYDFSRLTLPAFSQLLSINDTLRNVLLFIPLGLFLGLLPKPRRLAIGFAYFLPLVIEALQFVVVPLARGCQSADVIDNALGLTIGLVSAAILCIGFKLVSTRELGGRGSGN